MEDIEFQKYLKLLLKNKLPIGFDKWDLCNNTGWSIAHEAAKTNKLPYNFDRFDIRNCYGISVKEVYNNYRCGVLA